MSAECDLNTMKEQRSLKIGIKSDKEFFGELEESRAPASASGLDTR
jgi:hypothetical protein